MDEFGIEAVGGEGLADEFATGEALGSGDVEEAGDVGFEKRDEDGGGVGVVERGSELVVELGDGPARAAGFEQLIEVGGDVGEGWTVHEGEPSDDRAGGGENGGLALELGPPVGENGPGGVGLLADGGEAVEDEVGGGVDQLSGSTRGPIGDQRGGADVDELAERGVGVDAVGAADGAGVEDGGGVGVVEGALEAVEVVEGDDFEGYAVARAGSGAGPGADVAVSGDQGADEVGAELSGGAG